MKVVIKTQFRTDDNLELRMIQKCWGGSIDRYKLWHKDIWILYRDEHWWVCFVYTTSQRGGEHKASIAKHAKCRNNT